MAQDILFGDLTTAQQPTIGLWVRDQTRTDGTFADYIIGVDFGGEYVTGITVENLNIKNFSIGMYV